MKKKFNQKNLIVAAALGSLIGTVAINPNIAFADNHSGETQMKKNGSAKCADGSCGDKEEKMKKSKAKCADGSCGDKEEKMKNSKAKCADGSCSDKSDKAE